jgi:hypothetical protein
MKARNRLAVAWLSGVLLIAFAAAPITVVADGSVDATVRCSDGTETSLTVDVQTLGELTEAVEAMLLYPTGLSCSVSTEPVSLGISFGPNPVLAAGGSDFAVGGGQYVCGPGGAVNFAVSAHRHPNGTVNGSVEENIPQDMPTCGLTKGRYTAAVECFSAVGNTGFGKARFTHVSGYFDVLFNPGDYLLFTVTDNDPGPLPDTINNTRSSPCPETPLAGGPAVVRGNFVVRDQLP